MPGGGDAGPTGSEGAAPPGSNELDPDRPSPSGQPSGAASQSPPDGIIIDDSDDLVDDEQEAPQAPAECARETYDGERVEVNLYLLLDISGSMIAPLTLDMPFTPDTQRQWDAVRQALVSFIEAPESTGLNLAMNYYPLQEPRSACSTANDCENGLCVTAVCDIGLLVFGETYACQSNLDCGYTLNIDGELFRESCVLPGHCSDDPLRMCVEHSQCAEECIAESQGICPGSTVCDSNAYEAPAVDLGRLPESATQMVDSLLAREPDSFGATPTHIALTGAYSRVTEWQAEAPETNSLVVLATDGIPMGCAPGATPEEVAQQAETATLDVIEQAQQGGIDTFVIGVVPSLEGLSPDEQTNTDPELQALEDALNDMAELGGTGTSFNVSLNDTATEAFIEALSAIRGKVLPCEYRIPEPAQGNVSFDKLNVELGGTTIPKVESLAACTPEQDAWYYNVDETTQTPSLVVLCPETCKRAGSEGLGDVAVVLGCQTIVDQAR